jgi:dinuclear metal center YbgI/SA1388 family protein
METLSRVVEMMDQIAPTAMAESWDNVGLLVGDPQQSIARAMLCIDYTAAVADEARREQCELVIAYHPPIFKPLKRVTAGSVVFDTIKSGMAIYSPHTALDVAEGGTNDVLADIVGLVDRRPLRLPDAKAQQAKLVTFVPKDHLDAVSRAIFHAGAGQIGNYSSCSFRSTGTGTFRGDQKTNPTIGQRGQLEEVEEIKIETVVSIDRLATVVSALRAAHPYEEPAFDVVQLIAPPTVRGMGRIGRLDQPVARDVLIGKIKHALNLDHVLIAGPTSGPVNTAAVCAGSCGDLFVEALANQVDLYLTGEMRHHDALRCAEAGMTVICTLHSNSERVTLDRLRERLTGQLPQVAWQLAQADQDPFRVG